MREIVERFNVYKYAELGELAKEKAKSDYLNTGIRNEDFNHMFEYDIDNLFPNSDLELQYSLSCCQGDGVNVYGRVELCDLCNLEEKAPTLYNFDKFTEKEMKRISAYYEHTRTCICLPMNLRYGYCCADQIDFAEDIIGELQDMDWRNIDKKLIRQFESAVKELFAKYCAEWEKVGYEYLYEISDEDMNELAEANDWEFYENGSFYG